MGREDLKENISKIYAPAQFFRTVDTKPSLNTEEFVLETLETLSIVARIATFAMVIILSLQKR